MVHKYHSSNLLKSKSDLTEAGFLVLYAAFAGEGIREALCIAGKCARLCGIAGGCARLYREAMRWRMRGASGPMLKMRSRMERLGMKPNLSALTW